eukprot:CAMPEP_0179939324 /NCGR_PEP_ID=MMETSP0983-20121128/15563_1 /TAXON_ID=483367 /ORGANISM="non described non described, Strain CCMP 2436" /LENGTH=51 /DNA_ID=CAMNT_0021845633 /DNA_START=311 /DNA_END=462 /DNA_ORIENTATION=+
MPSSASEIPPPSPSWTATAHDHGPLADRDRCGRSRPRQSAVRDCTFVKVHA